MAGLSAPTRRLPIYIPRSMWPAIFIEWCQPSPIIRFAFFQCECRLNIYLAIELLPQVPMQRRFSPQPACLHTLSDPPRTARELSRAWRLHHSPGEPICRKTLRACIELSSFLYNGFFPESFSEGFLLCMARSVLTLFPGLRERNVNATFVAIYGTW